MKLVALGIDSIGVGLGAGGIQRCALLHVVEHQDRLSGFDPLAFGRQNLHNTTFRFRSQCHVGGRLEHADRVHTGTETGFADLRRLHRRHRAALLCLMAKLASR